MRKIKQSLLFLLAMTTSLNMFVTSCKDDDKDDNGSDAQSEAQYEQQQQGWDIITQLSDERLAPEGWEQKTFEPTIGTAKEGDPYTRIVMTNDVATAASRYSALTGASVDESAASHAFSLEGVGTLTYQRGSESEEYLGQVTVNIKQMPHLKKILYQNAQQSGQNATFAGSAYYRFGDVIQDAEGSYWICVRPSFGPEGKGDSHWMNVTTKLSEKNLFKYEYKGKSWSVPTGLGSSTEHMQNLVEMLYAMLKPADWLQNLSVSPKPAMFHDFSTSRIKYHNIYYWQRVCKAWEENRLFSTIFNESKDEMTNILANEDINFLYSGYSWYTKTSWNCQLFQATYKNGTGKQSNMHNVTYTKPTKRMENLSVDFSTRAGGVNGAFFDNDSKLRLIVRYKTGKQLSTSGVYNEKTKLSGCQDVYVYNKYYYPSEGYDLTLPPEETKQGGYYTTRGYYTIGDVVEDYLYNRWICIQDAAHSEEYDVRDKKWAYFISFDERAIKANGVEPSLLPKNLAMQTLFALETLCHNYQSAGVGQPLYNVGANIKNHAGVNIFELVGIRDTLFGFKGEAPGNVLCSFVSTLYYNQNHEPCVIRLIGDYTATQSDGGRDWSWHFFDSYTNTLGTQPVEMKLSDLKDLDKIRQYNVDPWVILPWYNVFSKEEKKIPSRGYRSKVSQFEDISDYYYQAERTWLKGNVPSNMYDEPIIVYAVKRLWDTGVPAGAFDDGTTFTMLNNMDNVNIDQFGPTHLTGVTTYSVYHQFSHQRFLNEKPYDFGITNVANY